METTSDVVRRRLAALALLALFVAIGWLTVAFYSNAFTKTETVTLVADRAGLQMRSGTIVKYAGVDVGKIESVRTADEGTVEIDLAMFPDMIGEVPADVDVALEQLTAFGNKAVVLRPAGGQPPAPVPAGEELKAGDTLVVDHISVEANQLFADLDGVLDVLEPAKVNRTLASMAQALDGQGREIGESLEIAERYFSQINDDLPTLQRDFDKGAQVLDTYTAASGDILAFLGQATTTADTVASQEESLGAMLESVTSVSRETSAFMAANTTRLGRLLDTALPTMRVLDKYAPVYACTLEGAAKAEEISKNGLFTDVPGVLANLTVLPVGGYPYDPVRDAPVMNLKDGPNCWGMPDYDGLTIPVGITEPWDPGLSAESTPSTELSLTETPLQLQFMGSLYDYIKLGGQQ